MGKSICRFNALPVAWAATGSGSRPGAPRAGCGVRLARRDAARLQWRTAIPVVSMSKPASKIQAKARTAYVCNECGADHNKWQGQCGECGAWNSLSEFVVEPAASAKAAGHARRDGWVGKVEGMPLGAESLVRTAARQGDHLAVLLRAEVFQGGVADKTGGAGDQNPFGRHQSVIP